MKKRRSIFVDSYEGTYLRIPSKKEVFPMIFLPFWLCAWAVGEFAVSYALLAGAQNESGESAPWPIKVFLMLWLAGWTYGGVKAFAQFFKMLFGEERVFLDANGIRLEKKVLIYKKEYSFGYENIRDVRLAPEGLSGGQIYFDYGAETIDFCADVEFAEAKMVYEELFEKLNSKEGLNFLRSEQAEPRKFFKN